jgi:hypothetical protein
MDMAALYTWFQILDERFFHVGDILVGILACGIMIYNLEYEIGQRSGSTKRSRRVTEIAVHLN